MISRVENVKKDKKISCACLIIRHAVDFDLHEHWIKIIIIIIIISHGQVCLWWNICRKHEQWAVHSTKLCNVLYIYTCQDCLNATIKKFFFSLRGFYKTSHSFEAPSSQSLSEHYREKSASSQCTADANDLTGTYGNCLLPAQKLINYKHRFIQSNITTL